MKKFRIMSLLACLVPVLGWANCPDINKVTFECADIMGKAHCQWTAPWWDGYSGDAEPGEHPVSFFAAFWGSASDPEVGSVNCFYLDKKNNLVELSQNNWGGIPKPTESIWRDGPWPGNAMLGKLCDKDTSACKFNYG